MAYSYYWRERDLMQIKALLEKKQKMTLDDLPELLTDTEMQELDAAETRLPVFDDDSPEMTKEQLAQFRRGTAQSHSGKRGDQDV